MCGGSGGNGGRSGGGAGTGDAGQPGEVVRAANQMKDVELVAGVKTLDAEYRKTASALDAAYESGTREQRMMLRELKEKLDSRKTELLREAGNRKGLRDKVKYERGYAVGFK